MLLRSFRVGVYVKPRNGRQSRPCSNPADPHLYQNLNPYLNMNPDPYVNNKQYARRWMFGRKP